MGTYTVSQYKTWVPARLQNITIDDTVLLQLANDANREVCNYYIPGMVCRFLQDNFAGTLTSGDLQYDFETNWKRPTDITLTAPDASASHLGFQDEGDGSAVHQSRLQLLGQIRDIVGTDELLNLLVIVRKMVGRSGQG